ncbi:SGNH/GDSL hydrolase family protein [Microbacterium sp. IEGM 1404]|uniref:SGNH/GDSL hydrolase family protein n=1 Tax=Microbacterium sp. IEGM 1404 TaxID=3047084 RepID=UPI0024B84736|nr:SGNH/GDSL hydrolase family protein [Microbacterium sp. IEGM 1404]MDI9890208.1 SGNH/GDSL hydrolase family protein [Microbacterium sp. IEGM 1404]
MIPRRRVALPLVAAVAAGGIVVLAGCAPERTDPVQALTFPAPTPAAVAAPSASLAPLRVVTLGDSLMSGAGLPLGEAWPALLAQREDVSLTNLACGGMGFVVTGECGTAYAGFSPAIAALQPDLIIVQSSSNDFWEEADEIRADTDDTIVQLHDAAPGARIVGLSTIWNDDPDVPDDTATTSDALRDAVDSVGGAFVDVGQPLVGHPEWLQDDDIHPTARGQKAIEQTVVSALQDAGVLP